MNLKHEYTRCCIPDIPMGDRRWPEGGVIPKFATTDKPPRRKLENLQNNSIWLKTQTLTHCKNQSVLKIKFVRKKYKGKDNRVKYKKIIKDSRPYRRSTNDYWYDIKKSQE